jgi:hypothetical protein
MVILWSKRAAAALSGILLMGLLFSCGNRWAGMAGGILNLAFAMADKSFSYFRRFFPPLLLVLNTLLSAYGVLAGGRATWAVLAAGASLFSWNAGIFLLRWPQPPLSVQYLYFKRIASILVLGLGAGISALALQGPLLLGFVPTLFLTLIGSVLFLRLISGAAQNPKKT